MTELWIKTGIVTAAFLGVIIWVSWWARSNEDGE
jgi:hypothetical protein